MLQVRSPDTDTLLLMNFAQEMPGEIIFDTGACDKSRLIKINDVDRNGHDFYSSLLGLHAFTGCDSNSSFMRKGMIALLWHLNS